jgi:oligopeptide/dipeptide ABC transporter, ATP-binding protein, C-terminal domain
MNNRILELQDLKTCFHTREGIVNAVDGVSYHLDVGEVLGVVGESGCGKSVTALSIMRLIPNPPGEIVSGAVLYKGSNLLEKTERQMKKIRGNEISMIFQEPMTSLNPLFKIGDQIIETIVLHQSLSKKEAREKAIEMLSLVGIPLPSKRIDSYPHELSGGMRQRVMIAMALSCNPEILLADEPTTALDVTIQAQILELMCKLKDKTGTSIIMITHDLGIVAEMCNRIVVMYCGQIVEEGTVKEIFKNPLHPYTIGLLGSIPKIDTEKGRLFNIKGNVPSLLKMPKGCRFSTRCTHCMKKCNEMEPDIIQVDGTRKVRCWLHVTGGEADV